MSIATATVSIAPYPVDSLSESEIQAHFETDETAEMEEACVKIESTTATIPEPLEEARVMDDAELTKMFHAVVKDIGPLPTPTPCSLKIPEVLRQPRKTAFSEFTAKDLAAKDATPTPCPLKMRKSAFSEFAKDLPPCCPMTMPPGQTTLPAQHVIAAFFAGALIGCVLVMCFSDTPVVAAE